VTTRSPPTLRLAVSWLITYWELRMNRRIKPVNPVIKALIQAPKHGGRHKGSRWKLFQEILDREIKERKNG
jgi:hypothetical protein